MQAATKRNVVCIDTRRIVNMTAAARKPADVMKEGHEQFIRNMLKDKLGWPRRDPAPEVIKVAAREMAARLMARDKDLADKKAAAKKEADAKAARAAADTAEALASIEAEEQA